MEILVTILGILLGGETLGFVSFFIYLKLNKREKETQVESAETHTLSEQLDLVDKYKGMVFDLQREREEYWKSNHEDMNWIKNTLNSILLYLDGPFQKFLLESKMENQLQEENKEQ